MLGFDALRLFGAPEARRAPLDAVTSEDVRAHAGRGARSGALFTVSPNRR
jgi:hypothetical protein